MKEPSTLSAALKAVAETTRQPEATADHSRWARASGTVTAAAAMCSIVPMRLRLRAASLPTTQAPTSAISATIQRATELYLYHQQGRSGGREHSRNPEGLAWQNVRRFYPNDDVAKKAIWAMCRPCALAIPGGVEGLTSGQFADMWRNKFARFRGAYGRAAAGIATSTSGCGSPQSRATPLERRPVGKASGCRWARVRSPLAAS